MTTQPTEAPSKSDEATLTELNERYIESFMKADVELFRRPDATTGISRYTDIYHRAGKEWKAISAQITRNLTRRKESLL